MSKISHYTFERPIKGICKSYGIWAHSSVTNSIYPIIYFSKPKGITDKQWEFLMSEISIDRLPTELPNE